MNFNKHLNIVEGQHAFLGASKYHWIHYDEDKVSDSYRKFLATQQGTKLHEFAASCIRLKQRLRDEQLTLNMYVNDAITFNMIPEQVLYYSENCFGTADAIIFDRDKLRIHDLKTGKIPAHMEQLEIYASLFCLEYDILPTDIEIELRLYQDNDVHIFKPDNSTILYISDKIVRFDNIINNLKNEGEL